MDPKDDKILTFMTRLSNLDKVKNSSQKPAGPLNLEHMSARGRLDGRGRYPRKCYM